RDRPFARRGRRRAVRDFSCAELDVDYDFGVFARRPFEGRFGVVGAGFGAFGDFDFGRLGVDFEVDRRFAFALVVADAALLARVGGDVVLVAYPPLARSRDRPFARRGRRLAVRDFSCAELDVDYDFGVFARRPFEGRFDVVRAGFGALRDFDFRRLGVDRERHGFGRRRFEYAAEDFEFRLFGDRRIAFRRQRFGNGDFGAPTRAFWGRVEGPMGAGGGRAFEDEHLHGDESVGCCA